MNLTIDIGNTRVKSAVFEGSKLIQHDSFALNFDELDKKIKNFEGKIIVSSVVEHPFLEKWKQELKICFLSSLTLLPIKINYETPTTLGLDRIANMVAINYLKTAENALAIDCGTCLKIDLLLNKEYLGGSISPGLQMRLKALHNFTSKLPLIEIENFIELNGKNTKESILSGCYRGMLAEIQQTIEDYEKKYTNIELFITGGDHPFFVNHLKNCIFADPFLTLKGLNEILNYQNN